MSQIAKPANRKWHKVHAHKISRREKTHKARIIRRRKGIELRFRKYFPLPAIFNLVSNHDETVGFINSIHKSVFEQQDNISLDFSRCTEISPEGCVVLAAEIDCCLRLRPRSVTGNYPNNFDVYVVLKALGFFDLLKIRADPRPNFSPDLEIARLISGQGKKEEITVGMVDLFEHFPEFQGANVPLGNSIFRALTEAMGNTIEHAYPESFKGRKDCVFRWWRAGFREGNKITLVLYDQGAGIPATLPATWPEAVQSFLKGNLSPEDGLMIKYATELNRSSAASQGRGKGLPDIKRLIEDVGGGMLKIQSARGDYTFSVEDGESHLTQNVALRGTLVIWIITAKERT